MIKLTYNKKDYELGFNRKTAAALEAQGFKADELTEKPSVMIPMLFYGAFMARNSGIKRNLVDEIFDNLTKKQELIQVLAENYIETVSSLVEDAPEGNAVWEVTK